MASASFDMDRLIASLTHAIGTGNAQLAKDIVTHVSQCHLKLDINVLPKDLTRDVRKEKEFSVDIHMEDRETTGTRFQMQVRSTDSVADLKRKVWLMHNIPTEAQRWIIGKKIPDDTVTLGNCGVNAAGHTLFLYIVTVQNENYRDGKSDHSLSPNIMTNATSYMEHRERPDTLLMNANVMRHPVQIKGAWLPGRGDPPPLPERIPLQDDCSDLDEQTKVVRDPLMQVIPPPTTHIHRKSKEETEDDGTDVINVFNVILDPTEKELQVDQSPGWECPVCTFFNLPTRPGCEMCSTNRPEGYIVPDNYQMTEREAAMRAQQDQLERLTRQPLPDEHSFHQLCRPQSSPGHSGDVPSQEGLVVSGVNINPHESLYRMFLKDNSSRSSDQRLEYSSEHNKGNTQNYPFLKDSYSSSSDCDDDGYNKDNKENDSKC